MFNRFYDYRHRGFNRGYEFGGHGSNNSVRPLREFHRHVFTVYFYDLVGIKKFN